MITLVLLFILLFVSIVIVILARSIMFLIPVVVLLIVYIIGLIIYRYKRFGISEFRIFQHQKEPVKFSDLILYMLGKIPGYRRIIKDKIGYADMILIDQTGIYLLKMLKFQGLIQGERTNETLENQVKISVSKPISNPFLLLDEDVRKIEQIYPDFKISTILVTNNSCSFRVNGVDKKEAFLLQDFYYGMSSKLGQTKVFTEQQVNEIFEKLSTICLKK